MEEEEDDSRTRKLPWIKLVEINLSYNRDWDGVAGAPTAEVMHDELLVGGMESEPRRQIQLLITTLHSLYMQQSSSCFWLFKII